MACRLGSSADVPARRSRGLRRAQLDDAARDGNPATEADPDWLPLINTPPYPDHPSGLACVASAMANSLRDFFDSDRVYSGIHFRIADVQGAVIGHRISRYRDGHYFRPDWKGAFRSD
jgi:hypothetical protein